ncbi:F-box protein [Cardamine amara subsp. amara]|uniref:F-box protein n=1 Tax=Cardamine amara subsp. amara TaxID=228776 RepID=A0ABD1C1B9_CARAN
MFLPLDKEEYEFYDPSLGKTHFCKFPELRSPHMRYSRDGWLLMHDSFGNNNTFFFNPFTHERIQVAWPHLYLSDAVAFSCAPTSSSCVIFSVWDITNTLITIGTYRPAIRERTTSFFPNKLPLGQRGFEHVVFSNGVFYCLTKSGCLGMFDLSKSSWNLLPRRLPKRLEASLCFMTEYEGDIYLVYSHGHQKPTYLRLDLKNRKWTEKIRFPGLTFYLGFQSAVTTNRDLVDIPKGESKLFV